MSGKIQSSSPVKKEATIRIGATKKRIAPVRHPKFSPSWVVIHSKETPGFKNADAFSFFICFSCIASFL